VSATRLRYLLRPREVTNRTHLQVLSVYRDHGIIPKDSRSDNFNKTPEDITRYQEVRVGDLVVNKMKAWQGSVGISAHHGIVSPDYLVCSVDPSLDSRFMHHFLRSAPLVAQYGVRSKGIRPAQWRLYWEDLAEIPVTLPTRDEQRRIANFLDAETARIDRMIEIRRASKSVAEEKVFTTITKLATVGTESVQETSNPWLPLIGTGWVVVPLKRRWRIIDCKHRTPLYVEDGYPVISPGDITPGRLDPSVAHRFVDEDDYRDLADNLRRARRGDIVYGRNASVGVAAFVDTDEKFTMGQDVCRITSADQDQLFLSYFLNTAALAQLGSIQIGSTFTRVNIGTLLELSVACPPREEQRRLAAEMDVISRDAIQLSSEVDRQLALLAERRQALITAAVTGGISV
jgi:type I restriction enzyme, S subunit